MKAVCKALGVSRSNISLRMQSIRRQASFKAPLAKPLKRVGRPAKPDDDLVKEIQAIIGGQPTYGYRRVWALVKRAALCSGREPVNAKRVYRAMKAHGLLLQRHVGGVGQRRHDGKIAVERSNLRWCRRFCPTSRMVADGTRCPCWPFHWNACSWNMASRMRFVATMVLLRCSEETVVKGRLVSLLCPVEVPELPEYH